MRKFIKKRLQKYLPKTVGFLLNSIGILSPKYAAKVALGLFVKPRGGRYKDYQLKYVATFQYKTLKLREIQIATYYLDKGHASTIMLMHGWESNASRWRKLVNYLDDIPYNIALIDGPAHGQSGSKEFTALLYAEMINVAFQHFKPDIMIGHSIGGFATAVAINQYSLQVQKVIILAAPNDMSDIFNIYFKIIGLNKSVAASMDEIIEQRYGHPMDYFSVSNYIRTYNQMPDGIIIHDRYDKINGYYNANQIIEAWHKGRLITTEGLGHGLQSTVVFQEVKDYILNS